MTKSGENIKHFIKFLPKLNNITLVKRLGDNWQRVVLDDITENGERIKFLPLLSTHDQPKSITLYGQKFRCKACVDKERNDTLFIFHVFDAAPGGPPKSLKEIDGPWGDFCCQGGHVERTIPLPPQLLASESQKACAEFIHPSAQLIDTFERHIRQIEIDLFDIAATERTENNLVLQECRKLWKDFELDKVVNVTIRQKSLLNELFISTERVEDVKELTERLSIPLLNAYVNEKGDDRFLELLHRIGRLPLPIENDPSLEKNNWKSVILTILRECAASEGTDQSEDSVVSLGETAENLNATIVTDDKSVGEDVVGEKETEANEETYPGQYVFSKDDSRNTAPGYFDADLQEQGEVAYQSVAKRLETIKRNMEAIRKECASNKSEAMPNPPLSALANLHSELGKIVKELSLSDRSEDDCNRTFVANSETSINKSPSLGTDPDNLATVPDIRVPKETTYAPVVQMSLQMFDNSKGCFACSSKLVCSLSSKSRNVDLSRDEIETCLNTIPILPELCTGYIRCLSNNLSQHVRDPRLADRVVKAIEGRADFDELLNVKHFYARMYYLYRASRQDPFLKIRREENPKKQSLLACDMLSLFFEKFLEKNKWKKPLSDLLEFLVFFQKGCLDCPSLSLCPISSQPEYSRLPMEALIECANAIPTLPMLCNKFIKCLSENLSKFHKGPEAKLLAKNAIIALERRPDFDKNLDLDGFFASMFFLYKHTDKNPFQTIEAVQDEKRRIFLLKNMVAYFKNWNVLDDPLTYMEHHFSDLYYKDDYAQEIGHLIVKCTETFIKRDGSRFQNYYRKGRILFKMGDVTNAKDSLETALKVGLDNFPEDESQFKVDKYNSYVRDLGDTAKILGDTYLKKDDYDTAKSYYLIAIDFFKKIPVTDFTGERMAEAHVKIGEFDEAEKLYSTLLNSIQERTQKPWYAGYLGLGDVHMKRGAFDTAEDYYLKCTSYKPQDFAGYKRLFILYQQNPDKFDDALRIIEHILNLPSHTNKALQDYWYFRKAQLLSRMGRLEEAIKLFFEIIRFRQPDRPHTAATHLLVLLEKERKYGEAIELIDEILLNHPPADSYTLDYLSYKRAQFTERSGDNKEAIRLYLELLKHGQHSRPQTILRRLRGLLLAVKEQGQKKLVYYYLEQVRAILQEWLQRPDKSPDSESPTMLSVLINLAWVYRHLEKYEQALEYLRQIIVNFEQGTHSYETYCWIATLAYQTGDKQSALDACDSAIQIYPDDEKALWLRDSIVNDEFKPPSSLILESVYEKEDYPAESESLLEAIKMLLDESERLLNRKSAADYIELYLAEDDDKVLLRKQEYLNAIEGLAKYYENAGDYEKARNYCRKYLNEKPEDVVNKQRLGDIYMSIGDLDKAKETFLEVQGYQEDSRTLLALGKLEKIRGNYDQALDSLFKGLKVANAEHFIPFYDQLGSVYLRLGSYDFAEQFFDRILQETDNTDRRAWHRKAETAYLRKDTQALFDHVLKALKLDPWDKAANLLFRSEIDKDTQWYERIVEFLSNDTIAKPILVSLEKHDVFAEDILNVVLNKIVTYHYSDLRSVSCKYLMEYVMNKYCTEGANTALQAANKILNTLVKEDELLATFLASSVSIDMETFLKMELQDTICEIDDGLEKFDTSDLKGIVSVYDQLLRIMRVPRDAQENGYQTLKRWIKNRKTEDRWSVNDLPLDDAFYSIPCNAAPLRDVLQKVTQLIEDIYREPCEVIFDYDNDTLFLSYIPEAANEAEINEILEKASEHLNGIPGVYYDSKARKSINAKAFMVAIEAQFNHSHELMAFLVEQHQICHDDKGRVSFEQVSERCLNFFRENKNDKRLAETIIELVKALLDTAKTRLFGLLQTYHNIKNDLCTHTYWAHCLIAMQSYEGNAIGPATASCKAAIRINEDKMVDENDTAQTLLTYITRNEKVDKAISEKIKIDRTSFNTAKKRIMEKMEESRYTKGLMKFRGKPYTAGMLFSDLKDTIQQCLVDVELSSNFYLNLNDEDGPIVYTDINKWRQILINLTKNAVTAIKLKQKGKKLVDSRKMINFTMDSNEKQKFLRIMFTDTGLGMKTAMLHPDGKERASGHHGLDIIGRNARMLGVDASTISNPGIGTTFEFKIIYGGS